MDKLDGKISGDYSEEKSNERRLAPLLELPEETLTLEGERLLANTELRDSSGE